jgi:outer membrane protein assembly factor BamB
VTGYGLADGKERWTVGGLEAVSVCPTPVVGDGQLYVMSRSFGGSALPAGMEAMMRLADKDNDGRLTREEAPFFQKDGAFDFIDSDRDGSVVAAEFKAASEHLARAEFGLFALRDPGTATGDLTATHVAWKHQKGIAKVTSPLLYRDRLWVIADGGLLTCTEPKTGRIIFERERLGAEAGGEYFASPVAADGRIFLCSTRGVVTVIEAADTLKVLTQTALGAPIQATPALVGKRLLIRTASDLYAFESPHAPPDQPRAEPPPR